VIRLARPDVGAEEAAAVAEVLDSGVLTMGRLEIARLDDDPSFPERGSLLVTTGGGK
jgi:hypothetical protein